MDSERGLLLGFPVPVTGWLVGYAILLAVLVVAPAGCSGHSGKERGRRSPSEDHVSRGVAPPGAGMQVPRGIDDPLDRAEKARRLAGAGGVDPSALAPLLRDPDRLVRGTVIAMLFLRRDGEMVEALGRQPGIGELEELRLLRAELAADGEAAVAAETCRGAVDEPDPAIRSRAARACVRAGDAAGTALRRLASDGDWQVRTRLAAALRRKARERTLLPVEREVLGILADDPHPTVATAAAGGGTGRGT